MAKNELTLIDFYYGATLVFIFIFNASLNASFTKCFDVPHIENKGWELVEDEKKVADSIVHDMADSIYFTSPEARASHKKAT